MKGKFPRLFKLVMALALVVGLVPIMAAPASAAVTYASRFDSGGTGRVTWDTVLPTAGKYSVKLEEGDGFARVWVPVNKSLASITSLSFKYKQASTSNPYFLLAIDSNGNGVFDDNGRNWDLLSFNAAPGTWVQGSGDDVLLGSFGNGVSVGDWTTTTFANMNVWYPGWPIHVGDNWLNVPSSGHLAALNLADWREGGVSSEHWGSYGSSGQIPTGDLNFSAKNVLAVGVELSGYGGQTAALVDSIEISGTTYDLEPMPSFVASPNTAGSAGQYSVTVPLFTALNSPADTVSITFPSGFTVPATISKSFVSFGGQPLATDPIVDGLKVTFLVPDSDPAPPGFQGWAVGIRTVVISQLAGIKNPSVGVFRYRLSIATSQETTAVNSNYIVIIRTVSRSPSSGVRGTSTTVSGLGFTSGTTVNVVRGRSGGNDVASTTILTETAAGTNFVTAGVVAGNIVRNISDGSYMLVTAGGVAATTLTGAAGLIGGNTNTWAVGDLYAVELSGPSLGSGLVGSDGTFTASILANVPPFAPGSNTLVATDGAGRSATTTFNINPSAVLNPVSGRPGTTIAVTARDFIGGWIVSTTVAGAPVVMNPPSGDSTPDISPQGAANYTIAVPALLAGDQNVVITDNSSGPATATVKLTILGSPMTASPGSGVIGTRVTVSGTGFSPSPATIPVNQLLFGGVAWNTGVAPYPGAITIDSGGNFLVAVPLTGAAVENVAVNSGTYSISASDSVGLSGQVNFTVPVASITLSTASSVVGSSVVVRGVGFPANAVAIVTYGPAPVGTGIVDSTGNFAAAISVPTTAQIPSTNTIAASATTAYVTVPPLSTPAQATHSVPSAAITLSATSGNPGSALRITGTGFPAYAVVADLRIGGIPAMPSPAPATDGTGNVTANVIVPAVPAGPAVVAITVGPVTGSTAFTVTTAAITPTVALAGIAGKYTRVWGYNAATKTHLLYDPAVPAISDLTVLTRGQGYWINATEAVTLVYGANQYVLVAGWNLIGWLD